MTRAMRSAGHVGERDWLALVAGDLAPARLAALTEHVSACGGCSEWLQASLRLDAALEALAAEPPAAVLRERSVGVPSPVGLLMVAASERGICRVEFTPDPVGETSEPAEGHDPLLAAARQELEEYFAGRRTRFDLPVDLAAVAPFQRQVLEETARIGFGSVATYGSLARALGRPRAARAVGGALHHNPVPIFIPCHRVVGTSGSLVGYAGGLEAKRYLLRLEGAVR